VLLGGKVNDAYVVDNLGDKVVENSSEGLDTVRSGIACALPGNVENLVLTGTAAINGTGNGLDNTLTGNSGNNVLAGGLGRDTLTGGLGADTFKFMPKPKPPRPPRSATPFWILTPAKAIKLICPPSTPTRLRPATRRSPR
jgi:hypothetical protein